MKNKKIKKSKTEEQIQKDLENVKNIQDKKAKGEKLKFVERNILNIVERRIKS